MRSSRSQIWAQTAQPAGGVSPKNNSCGHEQTDLPYMKYYSKTEMLKRKVYMCRKPNMSCWCMQENIAAPFLAETTPTSISKTLFCVCGRVSNLSSLGWMGLRSWAGCAKAVTILTVQTSDDTKIHHILIYYYTTIMMYLVLNRKNGCQSVDVPWCSNT